MALVGTHCKTTRPLIKAIIKLLVLFVLIDQQMAFTHLKLLLFFLYMNTAVLYTIIVSFIIQH